MSPQLLFASLYRRPYSTAQHIVCVSPASKTVMSYNRWKIRGFEQLLLLYHVSKLLQTIVQKFPLISETGGPHDRLEQQGRSLSHTWVKHTRDTEVWAPPLTTASLHKGLLSGEWNYQSFQGVLKGKARWLLLHLTLQSQTPISEPEKQQLKQETYIKSRFPL